MNSRYKDQQKQAKIIKEKQNLTQGPAKKKADEPLDYESLSSDSKESRQGPGCPPERLESKVVSEESDLIS